MHQAAFDRAGIGAVYEAWETPPEALASTVAALRDGGVLGANVTVPHKQAVMASLDEVDDLSRRIGAVNTIVNDGGRLLGANTDARGFLDSLREYGGLDPSGADAVLVGAGGAARAAAHALAESGVRSLTIANRTLERAETLAAEIEAQGVGARAVSLSDAAFADACGAADLIVNSTSVGMLRGPAEGASPVPDGAMREGCVVYDMVYNPPITPLLRAASGAGAVAVGGLPMLVYQGAASWTMWTGQPAPVDVMMDAARKALGLGLNGTTAASVITLRPDPGPG